VNQNYKELNLANQQKAKTSHYKIYKTLVEMHRNEPALTKGSYRSLTRNNDKVLCVVRNFKKRYVVLLMNFDNKNQVVSLSRPGDYILPLYLSVKVSSLGSGVKEKYVILIFFNIQTFRLFMNNY